MKLHEVAWRYMKLKVNFKGSKISYTKLHEAQIMMWYQEMILNDVNNEIKWVKNDKTKMENYEKSLEMMKNH